MGKNYFRIRLKNLSENEEDILTTLSFECGASGVAEALQFKQPNLTYEAKILQHQHHDIDVYFEERPGCKFFDGVLEVNPEIMWEINEEVTKDWLEEWKKGFKSFKLVDQFWIVPSWETVPSGEVTPIFIDPGMAFGTGTHATTQMAAHFLNKITKQTDVSKFNFLDVGTGTGILTILADKLNFEHSTGIEIDPEARRVANENITRNNVKSAKISDQLIEEVRTQFDVVIANIIDGVLLKIKEDLIKATKDQGHLFLTGILKENEDQFIDEFIENSSCKIVLRIEKEEWVGFWLEKNA